MKLKLTSTHRTKTERRSRFRSRRTAEGSRWAVKHSAQEGSKKPRKKETRIKPPHCNGRRPASAEHREGQQKRRERMRRRRSRQSQAETECRRLEGNRSLELEEANLAGKLKKIEYPVGPVQEPVLPGPGPDRTEDWKLERKGPKTGPKNLGPVRCRPVQFGLRSGPVLDHLMNSPRLIMQLFCVFWAKQSHLRGKWIFVDFHGVFSLINEKEEDKYTIWELIYKL